MKLFHQQICEGCKTPVFRPECRFVISCDVCKLIEEQSFEARKNTFNTVFYGLLYIPDKSITNRFINQGDSKE